MALFAARIRSRNRHRPYPHYEGMDLDTHQWGDRLDKKNLFLVVALLCAGLLAYQGLQSGSAAPADPTPAGEGDGTDSATHTATPDSRHDPTASTTPTVSPGQTTVRLTVEQLRALTGPGRRSTGAGASSGRNLPSTPVPPATPTADVPSPPATATPGATPEASPPAEDEPPLVPMPPPLPPIPGPPAEPGVAPAPPHELQAF